MLADERIKGLAGIASTDTQRKPLMHVMMKGNRAYATDGTIAATCTFRDNGDFPPVSGAGALPIPSDRMYGVPAADILTVAKSVPKRPCLPILKNLLITTDGHGAITTTATDTVASAVVRTVQEDGPEFYPNLMQVIPDYSPEERFCFSLSAEILQKIVNLAKTTGKHAAWTPVRFCVNTTEHGHNRAILFHIPAGYDDHDGITGIAMPLRQDAPPAVFADFSDNFK